MHASVPYYLVPSLSTEERDRIDMIGFFTMVGYKGKRTHRIIRQWFLHQKITKNLITILCQLVLLALTTMVLKRQDDRVVGSNEGGVS